MAFDPASYANEEFAPLLQALVVLAEQEERLDQGRFFASILRGIKNAKDGEDLADPFMKLSMSAFSGFEFSPSVAILLDQTLAKARRLSEFLSLEPSEIN